MRNVILLFALSVVIAGCAAKKIPLPTDNLDELSGHWINTDYDRAGMKFGKIVWKADGAASFYQKSTHERSNIDSNWKIEEKWKDSKGTIFLVVLFEKFGSGTAYHYYIRLNPDGSYHEMMIFGGGTPPDIDPNDPAYRIYYREQ
jgi:hypothetical protein